MAKPEYTEAFEQFWKVYPRKIAKFPAFKAWLKQGIDADLLLPKQIIGDIEKRTRLRYWSKDQTKIPHAATWINARRWDDTGWEEEIQTREDGPVNTGMPKYRPPEEPALSKWAAMLNRLFWNYYLKFFPKGWSAEEMKQAVRIKNETLHGMQEFIDEEIDNAEDKGTAHREMATALAKTMLKDLDKKFGVKYCQRVIRESFKVRKTYGKKAS